MEIRDLGAWPEHERVVECVDREAGYHGLIAVHSSRLGRAVGGTRFWPYPSTEDALTDVLRLSRAMSYKLALAGLALGGGKAVIIGDPRRLSARDRERVFRVHGRFIDELGGVFMTAEDVGTSPEDMAIVRRETQWVAGLRDQSGDPSPSTARGVFRAMQAAAAFRWRSDNLDGRTVALQGCGHVGSHLARELTQAGARLVLSDIDVERAEQLAAEVSGRAVAAEDIYDVEADVFAPCALGGVLNDSTIPRLKAAIVCGGANNQLLETRHGRVIEARGIVYVPDYLANAGGVINGSRDVFPDRDADVAARAIEAIYDTALAVLESARAQGISAAEAADRIAEGRMNGQTRA